MTITVVCTHSGKLTRYKSTVNNLGDLKDEAATLLQKCFFWKWAHNLYQRFINLGAKHATMGKAVLG